MMDVSTTYVRTISVHAEYTFNIILHHKCFTNLSITSIDCYIYLHEHPSFPRSIQAMLVRQRYKRSYTSRCTSQAILRAEKHAKVVSRERQNWRGSATLITNTPPMILVRSVRPENLCIER